MPINADEMLNAVSSAIDGDEPTPDTSTTDEAAPDTETTDTGEETTAEEVAEDVAAPDESSESTEEVSEVDPATGKTRARGPDGKFIKEPAKTDPATDGKPADGKDKLAAKEPAKKDPVNDPVPDNLKKETKERITSLISAVKTASADRDRAVQERDELVETILETGANVEQYSQALNYLKLVNSNDPSNLEKAIEFLQGELAALSKLAGKPVPGVDLLAEHADLRERVINGQLAEQDALELAAARGHRQFRTTQATRQAQQKQDTDRQAQEVQDGKKALNELGEKLKADPQFNAKNAILLQVLRPAIARAHPSQWAAIYKDAYEKLELPTAAAPPRAPTSSVPAHQPMRAKTPAGGTQKAPSSLLDAINFGLEQANG